MERLEILDILTDWNFWRKSIDTGIRRGAMLDKMTALLRTKEVVVVKGIRRSGKSTLMLQFCEGLIKSGVRKEDTLIVNFEDPRLKQMNLDTLNRIYEVYLTEIAPDERHYVFLDEVQVVKGWERFVRYLHENKRVNVFVTGSSSKLLSSEYSTVLAGRHLDIEVNPLSFREYLQFVGIEAGTPADISSKRHKIKKAFYNYLKWGGFPKVTLVQSETEKADLLETYFRDIIIKDIVFRHKVKEIEKLEELAKYYMTNVSALHSFYRIRNVLKMNLDTVERFSAYLSDVYMLSFVRKFSYSKKEQILNPRKVYCSDTGLRNSVAFLFSKDLGRLAENLVFSQLRRGGKEVYYWKGKHEADFVVKESPRIKSAIQVCWNAENPETKKREIAGLVEACKRFKLREGLIITEDFESEEKVGGIRVRYKPVWRWLLQD